MDTPSQSIVVVDLRIPFLRLVLFLVKLSLAAIPATIILLFLGFLVSMVVAGLFGIPMDVMIRRGTI